MTQAEVARAMGVNQAVTDDLRSYLLAAGLRHPGNQAGPALPALLGQLAQPHVTTIMDRLKPARTAALTVVGPGRFSSAWPLTPAWANGRWS